MIDLRLGDCLDVLRELDAASVDAIVTDPPYGIGFMGKTWDDFGGPLGVGHGMNREGGRDAGGAMKAGDSYARSLSGNRAFQAWCEAWATECLRVLKPGGHLVSFGGTRTYHRLAAGIEDAGFEIRDCLAWMFGSGFPKSLDVSKAIDSKLGAERTPDTYTGPNGLNSVYGANMGGGVTTERGEPVTAAAAAWEGWGTALKPAHEPIVLARKPLMGTVAANVLEHGTGALNVDACRIASGDDHRVKCESVVGLDSNRNGNAYGEWTGQRESSWSPDGRWPANVLLDEEAAAMLDEQTGVLHRAGNLGGTPRDLRSYSAGERGATNAIDEMPASYGDAGGASRFFYCAKVSRAERNAGLDGEQDYEHSGPRGHTANGDGTPRPRPRGNVHPTVKPIDLMRWLIRLVIPPGGTVLDPFLGSGSTGCAAVLEGRAFIGIDREPDYMRIAEARIAFWAEHGEAGLEIVRVRDVAERVRTEVAGAGQLDIFAEGAA